MDIVTPGTTNILLNILLAHKHPVLGVDIAERIALTQGAVWRAARRLNKCLDEFSRTIDSLSAKGVVIAIPLGPRGGRKFGYYLACFNKKTRQYLDEASTCGLLPSELAQLGQSSGAFSHLLITEQVLETEHPSPAEWFRTSGPTASDFEDRRVHRCKVVGALRGLVFANLVSVLKGAAASGKTVIVRTLMYELHKEGLADVHFFDIAPNRHFNEMELLREIRMVKGIVVIENIHLELRKAQRLYQLCKHDSERHILFTARHLKQEFQDLFFQQLNSIDKLILKPFAEANEIIKHFCSHANMPDIVAKKRDEILAVAKNDYWLLALALQGYAAEKGQGEPASWIGNETNRYLCNLETCGDPHDNEYPRILLPLLLCTEMNC